MSRHDAKPPGDDWCEPIFDPWQPPHPSPRVGLAPHRATLVLVLGILSLIVCAPVGIAAWVPGASDLKAMRERRMNPSGEGMTRSGLIIGIIGTVLFGLQPLAAGCWLIMVTAIVTHVR